MHDGRRRRESFWPGGSPVSAPRRPQAPGRAPHPPPWAVCGGTGKIRYSWEAGGGRRLLASRPAWGGQDRGPRPPLRKAGAQRPAGRGPMDKPVFLWRSGQEGGRSGAPASRLPAPGAAGVPTVPSAGGNRRLGLPPGAWPPPAWPPTPASPSPPSPGCPQNRAGLGIVCSFSGTGRKGGRGGAPAKGVGALAPLTSDFTCASPSPRGGHQPPTPQSSSCGGLSGFALPGRVGPSFPHQRRDPQRGSQVGRGYQQLCGASAKPAS